MNGPVSWGQVTTVGLPLFRRVPALPQRVLLTCVLLLCLLGAFAARNSIFDVWLAVFPGGVGFVFMRLGVPVLPLAFGAILSPILEENLRRTVLFRRDWIVFAERVVSRVWWKFDGAVLSG